MLRRPKVPQMKHLESFNERTFGFEAILDEVVLNSIALLANRLICFPEKQKAAQIAGTKCEKVDTDLMQSGGAGRDRSSTLAMAADQVTRTS